MCGKEKLIIIIKKIVKKISFLCCEKTLFRLQGNQSEIFCVPSLIIYYGTYTEQFTLQYSPYNVNILEALPERILSFVS